MSFFSADTYSADFPACLEQGQLLIPGRRTSLGQQLYRWFDKQNLKVSILGEFDDAAMMKAFGYLKRGFLSRRRFIARSDFPWDEFAR